MGGDLEPAPLEPSWFLSEPLGGRARVPLMHPARVEQERPCCDLDVRSMGMAETDRVGARKATQQRMRKARVGIHEAEAQRPQQRLRLLDPPAAIAMHHDDS